MIKIRRGVFETNSSSIHSICIQRNPVGNVRGMCIYFGFGEYGWEYESVDPASYLRTAMYELDMEDEFCELIEKLTDKYGIECSLGRELDGYFPHGYIDHGGELASFISCLLSDDDLLLRYLLGRDSCVYTGNDNSDEEVYSESDETHEVFWKGN